MQYLHLLTLASDLAAHVGRSETTIAKWCGVHARFFQRLRDGKGCNVRTAERAAWELHSRWPKDLAWPREVPVPHKPKEAA